MIRHGASMSEIAEVLRHRSQTTTAIYAEVSFEALRAVACCGALRTRAASYGRRPKIAYRARKGREENRFGHESGFPSVTVTIRSTTTFGNVCVKPEGQRTSKPAVVSEPNPKCSRLSLEE